MLCRPGRGGFRRPLALAGAVWADGGPARGPDLARGGEPRAGPTAAGAGAAAAALGWGRGGRRVCSSRGVRCVSRLALGPGLPRRRVCSAHGVAGAVDAAADPSVAAPSRHTRRGCCTHPARTPRVAAAASRGATRLPQQVRGAPGRATLPTLTRLPHRSRAGPSPPQPPQRTSKAALPAAGPAGRGRVAATRGPLTPPRPWRLRPSASRCAGAVLADAADVGSSPRYRTQFRLTPEVLSLLLLQAVVAVSEGGPTPVSRSGVELPDVFLRVDYPRLRRWAGVGSSCRTSSCGYPRLRRWVAAAAAAAARPPPSKAPTHSWRCCTT